MYFAFVMSPMRLVFHSEDDEEDLDESADVDDGELLPSQVFGLHKIYKT